MATFIRVDDFPSAKPHEFYKHNLRSFLEFHETIRKFTDKSYLLGVIPANCSFSDLSTLSTLGLRVGMHGIAHDERFQNEFRDFYTVNDRVSMLSACRSRLSDSVKQDVKTYMPPHNVIDSKTAAALERSGFDSVTTGPESILTELDKTSLKILHSRSPHEYGRSDELLSRGSVDYICAHAEHGIDVYLTLHFPWENNIGLENLSLYLEKIKHTIVDFK